MTTRRQHYNPRYYLQGFTESEDSQFLWRYEKGVDRHPIRMNVINAGVEKDYYSYTRADGTQDIDSVENKLTREIENPANPIIQRLRNKEYNLSRKDRLILAKYLTISLARVPQNKERIRESLSDFTDRRASEFIGSLSPYGSQFGEERSRRIFELIKEWKDNPPNMLFLPRIDENLSELITYMNWYFISPAKHMEFLSSDNPFLFTEGKGIQPPEGEIVFPISKNLVLWATWKNTNGPNTFVSDVRLTQEINMQMVRNATKYIYSHADIPEIAELVINNS